MRILAAITGVVLLVIAAYWAFPALMFRIESKEELRFVRVVDILIGLGFGVGLLLIRLSGDPTLLNRPVAGSAGVFFLWFVVSGAFLAWHELQVRVRWATPHRALSLNRVLLASHGLEEYARDHGRLPTREEGLQVMCKGSTVSDHYLEQMDLVDSWGQPLQYCVEEGRGLVWSLGADRKSGTDDDLRREVLIQCEPE
jgi:hypothetical protein